MQHLSGNPFGECHWQREGQVVEEMHNAGVIEPSSSPWASPVVLVRKKDGTRFCVDYRKLNHVTKKDSYPLLRIDDTLEALAGAKWFSSLDIKSGYWQLQLHPYNKEKTAFSAGRRLWQFRVMPFGLYNGPVTLKHTDRSSTGARKHIRAADRKS
jgi:hypothetical protein